MKTKAKKTTKKIPLCDEPFTITPRQLADLLMYGKVCYGEFDMHQLCNHLYEASDADNNPSAPTEAKTLLHRTAEYIGEKATPKEEDDIVWDGDLRTHVKFVKEFSNMEKKLVLNYFKMTKDNPFKNRQNSDPLGNY